MDRFNGLITSLNCRHLTIAICTSGVLVMIRSLSFVIIICASLATTCSHLGPRAAISQSQNDLVFAVEVPIPRDAEIQIDSVEKLVAVSDRSPAENLDFYIRELPPKGWMLESQKIGSGISLKFIKGSQLMSIQIIRRGSGLENKSQILILIEQ